MDVRYLILSLFFLASCMPSPTVSSGRLASTETTGGIAPGETTSVSQTPLSWNYLGNITSFITINVSNLNNAYIVGTPVEGYLSENGNFSNANYCLVSSYNIGGITYELRSRVVPISYYDFNARRTIRNLRVDFQDVTNSTSLCNKSFTTRVMNSSGTYVIDSSTPSLSLIFNDPSTLCPTCTSSLTASRVRLFQFKNDSQTLDEVPTTLIETSRLSLQVDPNFGIIGSAGSCTNSQCQAKGLDCCLENQCVNDGTIKPSAMSLYPSLLQSAEQERLTNPLAYLNYPQLYYICGSTVPSTGGQTGGSTGGATTYDPAFELLKKDYNCIEYLKSKSSFSPFHAEVLTTNYAPGTLECLTDSAQSGNISYYKNVLMRMYQTCGCNRTDLTEMVNNCPNYEYTVKTRDAQNQPTQIDCYTPPTNTAPLPLQQTVSVSGRSAPHRFFDEDGTEKELSQGKQQEGDKFEYLDEGKVLPVQQAFSMNAILGQMSVTLDKALPAKTVNVELDQVYFIHTTSGFYTPCPSCAKDSWLSSFTAFPTTSSGAGLQAVGHTTERDSFSTNTSAGNYEDLIFGRACWLPPTMIPFSHSPRTNVQDQRLNRLTTQAALFVNGYQRDWFGFNKGALIGSFDGVSWFAIGKGRIVRSTSKKLFLAINAPFADVASPSLHVVNVQAYDGITQAAQLDYDPQFHQYHPYQNEAGNCQKYHMCNSDKDCVTKLGWEYVCADVKDLRTSWPEFDADAQEKGNTSLDLTIDQILAQKRFPSSSSKRCVYRGAGAVCHTRTETLSSGDLNKRKVLTCAPNFFCASAASGGVHNNKIARFAATLEEIPVTRNHFFGKDANILGRPLDYLGTSGLTSTIRTTLGESLATYESTMRTNVGLCQPGKNLPNSSNQTTMWNPFTQHASADGTRRSDFISQIAGCNSSLFSIYRHSSCPVIGADGNYEMFSNATVSPDYFRRASNQNACGLESLLSTASLSASADTLQSFSPFRNIEARPLNSQIILNPTLVRDACLRRAGAVCHTDLDCSPNKKHAEQVDSFGISFFGNVAERSYWSESLVCGQADLKPLPTDEENFKNYDMSKNTCCREIGKDLTTFTRDIPTSTSGTTYDPVSEGLRMSVAPGVAPNDPKRYSRLATVENIATPTKPILSAFQGRVGAGALGFSDSANVRTQHQWKTLTEANSESCCGGGWIRKFSDGSNDWTRRDRVVLDVTNFKCINARTSLITNPEDVSTQYSSAADVRNLANQDFQYYCGDPGGTFESCAQYGITDTSIEVPPATDPFGTVTINTLVPRIAPANLDYFFIPLSADSDSAVIIDYGDDSSQARRNITIKLPSYVTREFDTEYANIVDGDLMPAPYNIKMQTENVATALNCTKRSTLVPNTPYSTTTDVGDEFGGSTIPACYFAYNSTTRVLRVTANRDAWMSGENFHDKRVGIEFGINPAGQGVVSRQRPGSNAWYLKRLGLLELSGIPQITYEALTCSDNSNRIVPGIFSPNVRFMNDPSLPANSFTNTSFSFVEGLTYFTNQHGLQLEPVFSANDFKCCSPLGKTVSDATTCCSGFAINQDQSGTRKTCALPSGTSLMVYFNRFVSNEGRGSDQPGGGLSEEDFNDQTGEPLLRASVNDKLRALGGAYCETGRVRQGGAFGSFEPEPQGPRTDLSQRIYNIVDSSRDIGQNSNAGSTVTTGYLSFVEGFRWNHHLYCED